LVRFNTSMRTRVILLCALLAGAVGCDERKVDAAGLEDGSRTFGALCARCHGPDGAGGMPAAAGVPTPRNFRDPVFQSARTDDELRDAIANGKGTAMPAFGKALSKREVEALVAHIRSIDPRRKR
jgi:mono/diheme cytochrome c family protein